MSLLNGPFGEAFEAWARSTYPDILKDDVVRIGFVGPGVVIFHGFLNPMEAHETIEPDDVPRVLNEVLAMAIEQATPLALLESDPLSIVCGVGLAKLPDVTDCDIDVGGGTGVTYIPGLNTLYLGMGGRGVVIERHSGEIVHECSAAEGHDSTMAFA